jgi:hypothetical protein
MLPLILLALGQDYDRVDAMMANYRELTRADIQCRKAESDDEIVVCARREADRHYRVPFVPAASPANSVPARTAALLEDHGRLPCGEGAFLHGCGMVGVTVGYDAKGVRLVERPRAP